MFTTHIRRYQVNYTVTIKPKVMIDFESFLSRITGKLNIL